MIQDKPGLVEEGMQQATRTTGVRKGVVEGHGRITLRRGGERGHFDHGWLDTYHTFSFGEYHDPRQMGFRSLRVINEDRVQAGAGFGMHGHRNMEIITYVLEGSLEHRDSMGNGSLLRAGDLQHMTAGTGIRHSEFNPSLSEPLHLYQIWLLPEESGLTPGYSELRAGQRSESQGLRRVASGHGAEGSLRIRQDAELFLAWLDADQRFGYVLKPGRHAWLQVLRGEVEISGHHCFAGDGIAVNDGAPLSIVGLVESSEVMLFDLA